MLFAQNSMQYFVLNFTLKLVMKFSKCDIKYQFNLKMSSFSSSFERNFKSVVFVLVLCPNGKLLNNNVMY